MKKIFEEAAELFVHAGELFVDAAAISCGIALGFALYKIIVHFI